MFCCGNCFDSEFLTSHISVESDIIGNCNICPAQSTNLISPEDLSVLFAPLLDLYQEASDTEGRCLIDLMREDWGLFFSTPNESCITLLKLIVKDNNLQINNYERRVTPEKWIESSWYKFKSELKHVNRYFPKSFPNKKELGYLLSATSLKTGESFGSLFRARINAGEELFSLDKMGAPPAKVASAGRANPFGISYLYVASNERTAISEIRPHKDDFITIAEFELTEDLELVDLRDPKTRVIPFRHFDEDLELLQSKMGLLTMLGEELTKPVSKDIAYLEYLSSQYVCEFIKSQGYDGVIYKSALGGGDNYAIFDESQLKPVSFKGVKVGGINIDCNNYTDINKITAPIESLTKKIQGVIINLCIDKSYGFIRIGKKKNIFMHFSSIIANKSSHELKIGSRVMFEVTDSPKGPRAIGIEVLS